MPRPRSFIPWLLLRALVVAGALVACASGCSKRQVTAPPPVPAPPVVEAVFPAARSTSVPYDSDIWIRFAEPLDLSSANTDNLFLKLDTVRIPIALAWEAGTRTLRITPAVRLRLRRTYTVEVTRRVRTQSGREIGDPFFWQFTTNSVRRVGHPVPADGATWESPFAALAWDSTETDAGEVGYEVFEGSDSAVVAAQSGPAIAAPGRGFWIPAARRDEGARRWWSVRATNHSTGESARSPAWRFDVLPAGTPRDSVVIPLADFGWWNSGFGGRVSCRVTLISGTIYNDALGWNLSRLGHDVRLADQDLVFASANAIPPNWSTLQMQLYAVNGYYNVCALTQTVPATEGAPLVTGERVGTQDIVRFRADAFAAHLEAATRYGRVWGYTIRSNATMSYGVSLSNVPNSGALKLVYYRGPTGPFRGGPRP